MIKEELKKSRIREYKRTIFFFSTPPTNIRAVNKKNGILNPQNLNGFPDL